MERVRGQPSDPHLDVDADSPRHRPVDRGSARLRAIAIIVCAFAVYVPCLRGAYLWDDESYVRATTVPQTTASLRDIWRVPPTTPQYYPVTFTSLWLEARLWGDAPIVHHVVNVLLHTANALLVWRVLVLLDVPGAYLAAFVFAVHPVHVESVAWIAERKNLLSGSFALIATRAWVLALTDPRRGRLPVVGAAFLLAMLSKTQACGLPVVLVLLAWWKRPDAWRRRSLPLVPLALVGLVGAALTVTLEPTTGEMSLPVPQLDPLQRIQVAGRALAFYAWTLLWPRNLTTIYGHWPTDPARAAAYAWPAAAILVLAFAWAARGRVGRGPVVALASFVVLLAPVLGLVDFSFMRFAFVADHFQYLASVPLLALGAAGATQASRTLATVGPASATVVLTALMVASWQRALVHRDRESLWRDNTRRYPHLAAPWDHLGHALVDQDRLDEARNAFATAVRLDETYTDAVGSLANVLKEQGWLVEATTRYEQLLRLVPRDAVTHNNLGVVLQMRGDLASAIAHFEEATRIDSHYAVPHDNWGAVLMHRDDAAGAIEHFTAAVRIDPTYAQAYDHWGAALLALGRPTEAAEVLATAAGHVPADAAIQSHWGIALANAGRLDEATARFQEALRLRPDDRETRDNLTRVLAEQRNRPAAP